MSRNPDKDENHTRKRNSNSSEFLKVLKTVIIEETSETSDITKCMAQYGCLIDSIQTAQEQAFVQMMILSTQQQPSKPAPIVLEIVQPEDKAGADGEVVDRRQIKPKKGAKDISANEKKFNKRHKSNSYDSDMLKAVPLQSGSSTIRGLSLGDVEINQIEEHGGEQTFLIPTTSGESLNNKQEVGVIEIHDEDQNQIILPPELQQPILQLLSTRGANLRKITFTHNDVIQTIEIVPPEARHSEGTDSNLNPDEGAHLILTSVPVSEKE